MYKYKYVSNMLKAIIDAGYKMFHITGQKVVRLYLCHSCGNLTMVKAYNDTDRWNACRCGYRSRF